MINTIYSIIYWAIQYGPSTQSKESSQLFILFLSCFWVRLNFKFVYCLTFESTKFINDHSSWLLFLNGRSINFGTIYCPLWSYSWMNHSLFCPIIRDDFGSLLHFELYIRLDFSAFYGVCDTICVHLLLQCVVL